MLFFSSSPSPAITTCRNLNLSLVISLLSSQNNNKSSNFVCKLPFKSICSSSQTVHQTVVVHSSTNDGDTAAASDSADEILLVRRPVMDNDNESDSDSDGDDGEQRLLPSSFDAGLAEFAKKMPIFEPERAESSTTALQNRLIINLELSLYRAKVLVRQFNYEEAQKLLQKCILSWPNDGRPYVALGKMLSKQSKIVEARAVYEKGCQATQGENSYIWQCWAVLEGNVGNIKRARELFDASTVADKRHDAAWHGWAVLELKQGNIQKARNLLGKGLKFCGGNEYIYQTLALLEAKANRLEQARSLFRQATKCNPKSCASWLAWAQLEVQQENKAASRELFEKAVQASPKNRFAWHIWGIFEANQGNIEKGRKLLKIGHALNPRDPVLLQSLALLEYRYTNSNLARVLFRKASGIDPRHQPVWMSWGWMEWKEGNISTARELYQRALMVNSTSDTAARCLQAWGVLEQRMGNLSAARRLFRSSLNINSQSYITWMTWASLEEDQGNKVRAEEIRDLYFQQRTEVVDDPSWVMGLMDLIDPAIDSIKRVLNLENPNDYYKMKVSNKADENGIDVESQRSSVPSSLDNNESSFDLDGFIKRKLSLDPLNLDSILETSEKPLFRTGRDVYVSKSRRRTSTTSTP